MLKKLKKNYFIFISTFLILYFFFNLLDGERGMFSYSKKIKILNNLQIAEQDYLSKIKNLEFKNSLLTSYKGAREIDLDYVEILIRSKFFLKKKK